MFNGKLLTIKNHFKKTNRANIILLQILLIGSFLRIYKLNFKGLWLDELSEVIVAESSTINGVLSDWIILYSTSFYYVGIMILLPGCLLLFLGYYQL
jgi:hypothetical protein